VSSLVGTIVYRDIPEGTAFATEDFQVPGSRFPVERAS
jgi:hypothetical protein